MTLNTFPMQPGDSAAPLLSWSVDKAPNFATRMQRAVSGRELRSGDYVLPVYTFTLRYEVLRDPWDIRQGAGKGIAYPSPGKMYDELRDIWRFYNRQLGPANPFMFFDASDNTTRIVAATPQTATFGVGDGVTTKFQAASELLAPVIPTTVVSVTPAVGFSVDANTGVITFASAPGVGVSVGADMTYNYKVRFADDSLPAENFLYQIWNMKTVKLVSVIE